MAGCYSGGDLYLIRGRVLWFPADEDAVDVQCVAETRKRKRCSNDLAHSAPVEIRAWWDAVSIGSVHTVHTIEPRGVVQADRGRFDAVYTMYEQQRCYTHV